MSLPVRHPDLVTGLESDTRRCLRDECQVIQAASQPIAIEPREVWCGESASAFEARRVAAKQQQSARVAAAIAEYRRVAAMWNVDVG